MQFSLPLRTVSESNMRSHWLVKAKRVKAQRAAVTLALGPLARRATLPVVVTITRISPGTLDIDNLWSSQKAVIDAIAWMLGIDDRDPRVTWRVAQRKGGKGQYGVVIDIQAREAA